MSAITTHILDTALGKPAGGIALRLEKESASGWIAIGESVTDSDGRCRDLCPDASDGVYRLTSSVGAYFERLGRISIYPEIAVTFRVQAELHYHLPILLSDYGYTTYRGS